jgi:hypothetical protein
MSHRESSSHYFLLLTTLASKDTECIFQGLKQDTKFKAATILTDETALGEQALTQWKTLTTMKMGKSRSFKVRSCKSHR